MNLIYFSPISWHSFAQRPHYLIHYLVKSGTVERVLWIDSYPTRLPRILDIYRKRGIDILPEPFSLPGLDVIRPIALPIEPLPLSGIFHHILFWKNIRNRLLEFAKSSSGKLIIGIGKPNILANWALDVLQHKTSFYDAMDDFPYFYQGVSKMMMAKQEKKVVCGVRQIWCSSPYLKERLEVLNKNITLVLNGYDMRNLPPPDKSVNTSHQNYVFGYIGTIKEWFDWRLVCNLAEAVAEDEVHLVGPCFTKIPRLPKNVVIFPACTQEEAIEKVQSFDVGLIPFKKYGLTKSVDPIKYYEYRALGKPVLSTRFGTMPYHANKGGVIFFEECDLSSCESLLKAVSPSIDEIVAFRQAHDWNNRFKPISDWINRK